MRIEFLGTGTSQGVPVIHCDCDVCLSNDKKDKRLRTSVYVQVNGKCFIIDIGPDFRYQMLRTNVPKIEIHSRERTPRQQNPLRPTTL